MIRDIIAKIPSPVVEKYYGCGSPIPTGIDGLSVLDLGSGSGRDCYIAASLVGPKGSVTGLDMTDEQLDVAKAHVEEFCVDTLKYPKSNLRFEKGKCVCISLYLLRSSIYDNIHCTRLTLNMSIYVHCTQLTPLQGYIEYLDKANIEDESMDMVISNCVINLSPDKPKVIQGVYNALRNGGELYFSDVYADRRLSQEAKDNEVLWGE